MAGSRRFRARQSSDVLVSIERSGAVRVAEDLTPPEAAALLREVAEKLVSGA